MKQVRWWVFLLGALALLGCEDPYKAPPAKGASTGTGGSLQQMLSGKAPTKVERWKIEVTNGYNKGPKDAPVTIVEFSDFQCPFCTRGAKTLDKLLKKYKGKVRLVFKHFPLSFHKQAHLAAQASLAAGAQGKFWPMHDKLFANYKKLNLAAFIKFAKELKLDVKKFKAALNDKTYKAQVDSDMKQGQSVKVSGTPTVFVNGRQSSVNEKKVEALIKEELARTKPMIAKGIKGEKLYATLIKDGKLATATAKSASTANTKKKDDDADKVYDIAVGDSPALGKYGAPVTLIAFSDFLCPSGTGLSTAIRKIAKAYKDKVYVVFKHNPHHGMSDRIAHASVAAQKFDLFWKYHDELVANRSKLDINMAVELAKEMGINKAVFEQTMRSSASKATVDSDLRQARQINAPTSTVSLYINGKKYSGGYSFANIKGEIDPILVKKGFKKADLPDEPAVEINLTNTPITGAKNPLVTLVEFSDFQCPFCTRAASMLNDIKDAYKKWVRVAFKQYPLSFHKEAHLAAQAALAANAQGKFWEYHDKLFRNQKKLYKADLLRYAGQLKLDVAKFKAALDNGTYKAQVDSDMSEGTKVGVSGTPTIFLNGRPVKAYKFADMKKALDKVLLKRGVKKSELPKGPPPKTINTKGAPAKGAAQPLVTVVEFSDFQCPFCSRAAKTINDIAKVYGKWVRVVFKQYPLGFHKDAHLAAQASLYAHTEGKFWEYHDLLFQSTRQLKRPWLEKYAKQLGLNMAKFKAALDNGMFKDKVDEEMSEGSKVGVSGTPSFFVNGRAAKSPSFDALKKDIDKILLAKGVKKSELPKGPPPFVINTKGAPAKGPATPLATIVEFSDFQCPYCGRAAKTLDKVAKAYSKWIRVVFKQYPLGFHKDAHLAAQAALYAHTEGKFWEYHDLLFQSTRKLKRPWLEKYAQQLGLNMAQFKAALDNKTFKAAVDKDMRDGGAARVQGTPSIYLNNKAIKAYTFAAFKKLLDPILLKNGVKKSELPTEPVVKIPTDISPAKGPENAPVTVVEFSDFQCPYCSRAVATLKKLQKTYGNKIRIVFKQYPLSFHKDAHLAAQASLAAHAQGKFWPMHDKLFANYRNLKRPALEKYAKEVGLDLAIFKQALDSGQYKSAVDQDMKDGGKVGVNGTPSFFVENVAVSSPGFAALKKAIDAALAKKGKN